MLAAGAKTLFSQTFAALSRVCCPFLLSVTCVDYWILVACLLFYFKIDYAPAAKIIKICHLLALITVPLQLVFTTVVQCFVLTTGQLTSLFLR